MLLIKFHHRFYSIGGLALGKNENHVQQEQIANPILFINKNL